MEREQGNGNHRTSARHQRETKISSNLASFFWFEAPVKAYFSGSLSMSLPLLPPVRSRLIVLT